MRFILKYIKRYFFGFALAIFCLAIESTCDIWQPYVMSHMVDLGVRNGDTAKVLSYGLIMLMITGIGAIGAIGRNYFASVTSQKFARDARKDIFTKIESFSSTSFDKFSAPSLMTRLTNDVTQVQNFLNGSMRIFIKAPILSIGALIMMFRMNPHMALTFLYVFPIVFIIIFTSLKVGIPFFARVQTAIDNINLTVREYLLGVRVVKAFNRFEYEKDRFSKANANVKKSTVTALRVMASFPPSITLCVNLGIAILLWRGGHKVAAGDMQIGQVMAFVTYLAQILQSLSMLTNIFNMVVRAKASGDRIQMILNTEDHFETEQRAPIAGLTDSVVFENVGFSYPTSSGAMALKDISFTCKKGATIGIIGPTGSGKSTLVSLLLHLYDTTEGRILIDGRNINEFDHKALRNIISVVPQKSLLFSGSIEDNIRWGKGDATMDEIKAAAEAAQIGGFVETLPEKYDAVIGQGGTNFSGGQKQRISIARALVRQPDILILDDCTSAVDVTTENAIRHSLTTLPKPPTCFYISQRISSIMNTDVILVLENAVVAGFGTHEELMQSCEIYQDIYHSQLGKDDLS